MATAPTSTNASKDIQKGGYCSSQFFQPKSKPVVHGGANRLRAEEKNIDNVVVLDDIDDDLDESDVGIVDLNDALEPKKCMIEESQIINDKRDEKQSSLSQKNLIPSNCVEDAVQGKMEKRKDLNHLHGTDSDIFDAKEIFTIKQDPVSSPEKSSVPVKKKENPFAKFAASAGSESRVANATRTAWQHHSSSTRKNKRPASAANIDDGNQNEARSTKIQTSSKDEKKKEKKFVKIKDISPEEQNKIIRKWHSMADPLASLEDRRYQILLAARLHARCQEPTVRKAMLKLREHFAPLSEAKTISIEEMAMSDPEELAGHISNLQFYNVKAKQIVKAAQEIQSRHGSIVPEDELSLLQITGIGKTFADLLAFVNKRETHERLSSQAVHK